VLNVVVQGFENASKLVECQLIRFMTDLGHVGHHMSDQRIDLGVYDASRFGVVFHVGTDEHRNGKMLMGSF
jgi:hypothetical protein